MLGRTLLLGVVLLRFHFRISADNGFCFFLCIIAIDQAHIDKQSESALEKSSAGIRTPLDPEAPLEKDTCFALRLFYWGKVQLVLPRFVGHLVKSR